MKTNARGVPGPHDNKVNIGGSEFEIVDESDGDTTPEIRRRIMAASRCYFRLLRHLRSKLLPKMTKCKIYKTLIRPILTYGCESWILKKNGENLILVFERKVLHTIFSVRR